MTAYFGTITIGADPIQIPSPTVDGKVNKLFVQHAPGNTGVFKVGRLPGLTTDNTTPGIFVAPNTTETDPGGDWSIESPGEKNDINLSEYRFHGTHAGDLLHWQINVAV
jgi:hypothetical protein